MNAGGNAYGVLYLVFNTLIKINTHDPLSDVLLPDLASSWEGSPDATSFTFHLRNDVTWQDGEPFTAADVAFSMNWSAQNYPEAFANAFVPTWTQIQGADEVHGTTNPLPGVTVVDDFTIQVTLKAPNAEFLRSLTEAQNVILPEHLLKDISASDVPTSEFATTSPVGTGPYRAVKIERDLVELQANDTYFKGRPNIDQIFYQTLTSEATLAQLESGQLGLALRVDSADADRLASNPNLQIVRVSEVGTNQIVFRHDTELFKDKRVRQAFAYAIDRRGIIESILQGHANVLFLPPGFREYEDLDQYPLDTAKATQLLQEAAFDFSKEVRFLYPNDIPNLPAIAPIVQQQLEALGVKVSLMPVDSATWAALLLEPDKRTTWDMAFNSGGAQGLSPSQTAQYYGCENLTAIQMQTAYVNCELTALFEEASSTLDPQARDDLYHDAARILNEDVPDLWLWQLQLAHVATSALTNFAVPPFERWAFLDVETWDLAQ